LLQEHEAKVAALERLVGRQAMEIEFLKGALKNARPTGSARTSMIVGPTTSPLQKAGSAQLTIEIGKTSEYRPRTAVRQLGATVE
jgi:hypothetical protein